jgi:hypothetical protein
VSGYARILCLSDELESKVDSTLLSKMQLDYSVANAEKWSNFPPAGYRDRLGPTLSEFSSDQLPLVLAIIKEASGSTPNEGFDEVLQILDADDYLAANATGQDGGFGAGNFHFAFLGTPAETGTWELYYGGHHTAVADTYQDGQLIGATPSFRGVEPNTTFTENGRTNQPMQQEQAAFAALLGSLAGEQATTAKLSKTYSDLLVGPQKDGQFPNTPEGLKGSELSSAQKELVTAAISTYVNDIGGMDAKTIIAKYVAELDDTYTSYSGTTTVDAIDDRTHRWALGLDRVLDAEGRLPVRRPPLLDLARQDHRLRRQLVNRAPEGLPPTMNAAGMA